jgi:SAM-dependent methyltransferase
MDIQSLVRNELVEDSSSSVWLLKDHSKFGYSDGAASEQYLDQVLRSAGDLSTRSDELAGFIKDWPSEYHLSAKRAQLLSGFNFDRSSKVLEVGCGCGAITRHLGETFDSVMSIEGSINRARLARLRTRDQDSVSIICAPFQNIEFREKFDIIFVIGVYEYSGAFVEGENPYDAVLKYFSELLTPNGMVVIAIENQFGLKYFNGCREDHIAKRFEGLEGYHRREANVRTFGKTELEGNLKPYFPHLRFYYPYPDYKMPDCVLSDTFLSSTRAGELVSQMTSRDYSSGPDQALWDEGTSALELARNRMLEFFANSFLVVAGKTRLNSDLFQQLAVLHAPRRNKKFAMQTRILEQPDGSWMASKRTLQGLEKVEDGLLQLVQSDTPWRDAQSLQTQVRIRAMSETASLEDIFAPCHAWLKWLRTKTSNRDGREYIGGEHVDSIWQNFYVEPGHAGFIDREWVWKDNVPLNVVAIRAIYHALVKIERSPVAAKALAGRSGRTVIERVAAFLGLALETRDFQDFVALESDVGAKVFGRDRRKLRAYLNWYLKDRPTLRLFDRSKKGVRTRITRVRTAVTRRFGP